MEGNDHLTGVRWRHGPAVWAASLIGGLLLGAGAAYLWPGELADGKPVIKLWLVLPFALLLASIAIMPFISERVWHRHFPDFSFALGGFVAGYVLRAYAMPYAGHSLTLGQYAVVHALIEYYSFVALVCGLYVVCGGVSIRVRGRASPIVNTGLLAFGALLANAVGTTGASMLLLRPFMIANEGRLRPFHVVMFIMIVSNCGGCLTPIGDPPLYLGFLKGVPFSYSLTHFWPEWLLVCGSLLAVFVAYDKWVGRSADVTTAQPDLDAERGGAGITIRGGGALGWLALMVGGVFIDPMLKILAGIEGLPIGATFQLAVAIAAYFTADRKIQEENQFSFFPVKEVGLLFLGIFLTMIPALAYLALRGPSLGVDTPTAFYFATGSLSAVLDNAPTYLNFLAIALAPEDVSKQAIDRTLADPTGRTIVAAISTGAVFFGALTYIGNGPNFMVRTIAQSAGVKMPSFFGYSLIAILVLLPILVLNWALFIR